MARIVSVAGNPTDGSSPIGLEPNRFFAQGDSITVPDGVAVEISAAEGTRVLLGQDSTLHFRSITAQGMELRLNLELQVGEVTIDVAPIQEVRRSFNLRFASKELSLQPGLIDVVVYPQMASKVASLRGSNEVAGVQLDQGKEVMIDPQGAPTNPSVIPTTELTRLRRQSQSPTVSRPPPYLAPTFLDRFGVAALVTMVFIILGLWLFFKQKPKSPTQDTHLHEGIKWQKQKRDEE